MAKRFWKASAVLCLLAAALWRGPAIASMPALEDVSTIIGDRQVVYPQLTGMENAAIQQKINDDIVLRADIARHLFTLSTLTGEGLGLVVDYDGYLRNGVLSVTISARGQMGNGREGQAYTALCYNLETGGAIAVKDLFTDADRAVAWMEERAADTMEDEISGYLEYSDLAPLPAGNFALDADGITFYYPSSQFQLMSGYCGACQFYYEELNGMIDWDGVLGRLEAKPEVYPPEEAREKIIAMVKSGRLPHVPVAVGEPMAHVRERYRVLREPDQYPGGKYYQLEQPAFRQVLVLSDLLPDSDAGSVVAGIQSARANLFGIRAGETTRREWRAVLGEPDSTVQFDESLAYDYRIPQGESDFYAYGDYQLRLHAGQDGVLHNIRITR